MGHWPAMSDMIASTMTQCKSMSVAAAAAAGAPVSPSDRVSSAPRALVLVRVRVGISVLARGCESGLRQSESRNESEFWVGAGRPDVRERATVSPLGGVDDDDVTCRGDDV